MPAQAAGQAHSLPDCHLLMPLLQLHSCCCCCCCCLAASAAGTFLHIQLAHACMPMHSCLRCPLPQEGDAGGEGGTRAHRQWQPHVQPVRKGRGRVLQEPPKQGCARYRCALGYPKTYSARALAAWGCMLLPTAFCDCRVAHCADWVCSDPTLPAACPGAPCGRASCERPAPAGRQPQATCTQFAAAIPCHPPMQARPSPAGRPGLPCSPAANHSCERSACLQLLPPLPHTHAGPAPAL